MYKEMEPCMVESFFLQEQCSDIRTNFLCDAKPKYDFVEQFVKFVLECATCTHASQPIVSDTLIWQL